METFSTRRAFASVFFLQLLVVASLALVRLFFCIRYASADLFCDNYDSIPLFLLNALRFDAQVGAYASLPLLLVAIAVSVSPTRVGEWARSFTRGYVPFAVVLVSAFAVADVHYYNNFNRHFDIVVFDFFDEDPAVLVKGIWDEAPILLMSLAAICLGALAYFSHRFLLDRAERITFRPTWATIVAVVVLLAISLRGSLGVFTLRIEDTYVSTSPIMNDCVPNGLFMLKNAWSEKKKQFVMASEDAILRESGFSSMSDAIAAWRSVSPDVADSMSVEDALLARTPDSVLCPGMNVVLIVCESWGNKLIDYQDKYSIDLLDGMRDHFADGLLWRRFVSSHNGTIDAVESFVSSSPYERLFTSKYRDRQLLSASARLFKRNGYDTQFISGIEISWRNLISVLPHQGFDRVVGKFEILKDWPQASTNHTWGVYDHDMLRYLLRQLEDSASCGRPQFVMALTSTNHTPFEFPADEPVIDVPDDLSAFAIDDRDVIRDYLMGYHYTSRSLAQFLSALKNSKVASNTIVAITGDHNTRLILPYSDSEEDFWTYSVPLYMYIPGLSESQLADFRAQCSECASHKDVIPTLANLSLPSADYYAMGRDLLRPDSLAYGKNVMCLLLPQSVSSSRRMAIERKANAHEAIRRIWFRRQFIGSSD